MSITALPGSVPAVTSAQNATTAAVDLTTSEGLANALKTNYNAAQVDIAAIHTYLVAVAATVNSIITAVAAISTGSDDEGQDSITGTPTYTGGDGEADGADPLGASTNIT